MWEAENEKYYVSTTIGAAVRGENEKPVAPLGAGEKTRKLHLNYSEQERMVRSWEAYILRATFA